MTILLISPNLSQVESAEGDSVKDAIESFISEVWTQGWNADEKVHYTYGDWLVYKIDGFQLNHLCSFSEIVKSLKIK